MAFEFHKPVYTGNTIRCKWTNDSVEERDDRYAVTSSVVCTNETDETVMEASIDGVIWKGD